MLTSLLISDEVIYFSLLFLDDDDDYGDRSILTFLRLYMNVNG